MLGEIVDNLERGKYRVMVRVNNELAAREKDRLEKETAKLLAVLDGMAEEEFRLRNRLQDAAAELDTAIVSHDRQAITKASVAHTRLYYDLDRLLRRMEATQARLVSLQMDLDRMTAASVSEDERILWCADYSDELEGRVGLAPIAGNPDAVLIAPGGKGTDTHLLMTSTMPRHMAAWHQITEPAMEKWWPTFRTGTITELDMETGLASIALHDARSRLRPDISQNTEDTLDAVPVSYMACDHRVFREGDGVLVRWIEKRPVVVGFVEHPRPCGERVWVTFSGVTGSDTFAAFCTRRIAEIQKAMAHVQHTYDVFVPKLLSLFRSWLGRPLSEANGVIWNRVTQEDVDRLSAYWVHWRRAGPDDGPSYAADMATAARAIHAWEHLRALTLGGANALALTVSGGLNPGEDMDQTPLTQAIWVQDGCPIDMDPRVLDGGNHSEARYRDMGIAAGDAWADMMPGCSPVSLCALSAGTQFLLTWQSRVGFYPEGESVFLAHNPMLRIAGFEESMPAEGVEIIMGDNNGGELFVYPPKRPFHGILFGTEPDASISVGLRIRVRGWLSAVPDDYGVTVIPASPDNMWDFGGVRYDPNPYTWMGFQAAGKSFRIGDVPITGRERVPMGFEYWAGANPEHPLVTGRDDGRQRNLDTATQEYMELIQSVNRQVNHQYSYREESPGRDDWRIMTLADPWGDCEDFALTKIERLLDAGVSVKDVQIQCGYRWEASVGYRVGHAWVLVCGRWVMDVNGDTLKTPSTIRQEWGEIVTQRKLEWTYEPTGKTDTALPWPHKPFDLDAMAMTATVARWGGLA